MRTARLSRYLLRVFLCLVTLLLIILPDAAVLADDGQRIDQYTTRFTDRQGKVVDRILIPGSPPPKVLMDAVRPPELNIDMGTNTLTEVPAFNWIYGCTNTAAGMLAGYYDQPARGYTNIYTGPANGGVCPLNNELYWGNTFYDDVCGNGAQICGNNPLVATKNGLDGRATRGHVNDYWQGYACYSDPYYGNWTPHADDSLADFMGTSQRYKWQMADGGTRNYAYPDNTPTYDYTGDEPNYRNGDHGIKLFLQSRGYTVNTVYTQYISGQNGLSAGFTYAQFKAEIDAGRPVIIHLAGHSMLGVGYNDTGNNIYIHDTWDHSRHEMVWGGTYAGMQHNRVTVVQLAPNSIGAPALTAPASTATVSGTSVAFSWQPVSGAVTYALHVSTTANFSTGIKTNLVVGNVTSYNDSGYPNSGTTYYWRVFAWNGVSWSPSSEVRSFINGAQTAVQLSSPANGATVTGTSVAFSWQPVSGAVTYALHVSTTANFSTGIKTNLVVGNVTSYNDSGYSNSGTTYYWRVFAWNGFNWSPTSEVRSFINGL